MLNRYARAFFTKVFTPFARLLVRLGVSPDVVTVVGTLGVCFGALWFYPRGQLLVGTLVITAFVFSDTVDGVMARLSGRSSTWGAYLDSTLDREHFYPSIEVAIRELADERDHQRRSGGTEEPDDPDADEEPVR